MVIEHKKLSMEWVGQVSHSIGMKSFLQKKVLQVTVRRHVIVIGTISGKDVLILNSCAPTEDNLSFYRDIKNIIANNTIAMMIPGRDFNVGRQDPKH